MVELIEYEGASGVEFSVEVDYNMTGYAEHTCRKMRLTPRAAYELSVSLIEAIEWAKHPLYKWAVNKTKDRL